MSNNKWLHEGRIAVTWMKSLTCTTHLLLLNCWVKMLCYMFQFLNSNYPLCFLHDFTDSLSGVVRNISLYAYNLTQN